MRRAVGLIFDGAAPNAPPIERLRRLLAAAIGAFVLCLAAPVTASDRIEVRSAELRPAEAGDDIDLHASFDFELPWALEDAVNRGIALYFVVEFELYRTRWYWFDDRRVGATLTYRLSYSPLSRQYRLARGSLALPFDTLGGALASLRRLANWTVIERNALSAGESYSARVRLRLDTAQLPRPFQMGALTNRDWTLASEWRNVPVTPDLAR
jgi:hypothetical protein